MLLGGMFQLWLLFDENGREIWRRSKEARVYDFCEEEEGWIKWQIWIFQIWVVCFREGKTTRDGKPLFEPMFFFPLFMLRTSCVHEVSNKKHLWGIYGSNLDSTFIHLFAHCISTSFYHVLYVSPWISVVRPAFSFGLKLLFSFPLFILSPWVDLKIYMHQKI